MIVKDVFNALNILCKDRCLKKYSDFASNKNSFIVTKSSNIPGKAITELPGLICGDLNMEVKKIAVIMTLTENVIELAAATEVNVIIAHHPVGDACSCGGVLLKNYLNLYNIALFELHEAFHGLHPGISFLHGYNITSSFINYDGISGNIFYIGRPFKSIKTLGDILDRLDNFFDFEKEKHALGTRKLYPNSENICDISTCIKGKIILGTRNSKINKLLHFFPHTGFTSTHLETIITKNPDIDTLLVSISRVYPGNPLIKKAKELNLNLICGNSHTMEIYENGLPLAFALKKYLKNPNIVIFREAITSIPLENTSTETLRNYGYVIADKYL